MVFACGGYAPGRAKSVHEELDARRRTLERLRVEQVGRACGCVQRVAHRDLVADDEDRVFRPLEQAAERTGIAPGCVVEALAAGERLAARMRPLPRAVLLEFRAL